MTAGIVATAIALAALAWQPAQAQVTSASAGVRINRCVNAQGHTVFTDRSCADMGASPLDSRPGDSLAAPITVELTIGCADSLDELRRRLETALRARDVNAMAALHDWVDAGPAQAEQAMTGIQALLALPAEAYVVEFVEHESPPMAPPTVRIEPRGPGLGAEEYRLLRHAGCWWLARG